MSTPNKTRYLAHMTAPDIAALDKEEGVVLLPIGAVEQHGGHLPVLTDNLIANGILDGTVAQLPDEVRAWVLPAFNYGKSTEHINFSGTITLSASTLIAAMHDIGASVQRLGFRRLAFINGHGGNRALLEMVAREIRVATGLMCFTIQVGTTEPPYEIDPQEWRLGIHAGETETSLILALAPELVQMEHAVRHFAEFPAEGTDLFFFGPAATAWLADDWSPTGVYGDATQGTAEKGELLLTAAIADFSKLITVMSRFEVAYGSSD